MSLISYLTKIHFADNILDEALRAEIQGLCITRPFLVTDEVSVASGLVERIVAGLGDGQP